MTVVAQAFGIDPSQGGVVWVGPREPTVSLVLLLGVLGSAGLITGVIGVAVSRRTRPARGQDLR